MKEYKVEASLKYGKVLDDKRYFLIKIFLIISMLFPIITLLIIVTILAGGMKWQDNMLIGLIAGNALSLLLFFVLLYSLIMNKKIQKYILLCLYDCVELNAIAKRLDFTDLNYMPYQIQVEFELNGEKNIKISSPGNAINGYHKIFGKYDNKKIKILYSKKYDEVLILHQ